MGLSISQPLARSNAVPRRAVAATLDRTDSRRPPPQPVGQRPAGGLTRSRLAILAGTLVVAWIVVVFAHAVSDSADSATRADAVRRDTAAAAARLVAEQAELQLIQTPAYIRLEARAYGYGQPGERAFALEPDAPPAPSITPLGTDPASARPRSPLEAWLELLFGP
ncbi:MAG: hypothetical protein ACHQ15_03365 [Candidatus Limnocylindrales bacterium]